MTKFEKLLAEIRNNPKNVSFDELDKVMHRSGFERRQPSGGSSHFTYYHPKYTHLIQTVPFKRPIKAVYVKECLSRIDELLDLLAEEE